MRMLLRKHGVSEGLMRRLVRANWSQATREVPELAMDVAVLVGLVGLGAWLASRLLGIDNALLHWTITLSVIVLAAVVLWKLVRHLWASGGIPAVLPRVGLCSCCGYEIAGLPADEQGVVVCPECGAAFGAEDRRFPTERTLEKAPWFDSRWHKLRKLGWRDPAAPARAMEMADHPRMLGMGAVYLGLAIGFVWVALQMAMPREWANAAAAYGFPVYIFGIGWVMTRTIRLRLRREGWCPACLASLADLPPEDDGCKVCAVCGAAWKVKQE